jgi:hypothetical protein
MCTKPSPLTLKVKVERSSDKSILIYDPKRHQNPEVFQTSNTHHEYLKPIQIHYQFMHIIKNIHSLHFKKLHVKMSAIHIKVLIRITDILTCSFLNCKL